MSQLASLRPLWVALMLVSAWFGAAPGCALGQDETTGEDPLAAKARGDFQSFWDRLEEGIIDLHGGASEGAQAARLRVQLHLLMRAVASRVGGSAAAGLLWKAAIFHVDPKADQGTLFIRSQPWYVRRQARQAIAAIQPAEALLPWLRSKLAKGGRDPRTSPRLAAIEILGCIGGPQVKPLLMPFLRQRVPDQQIETLRALADACPGDPEVALALLPLVKTGDPNVKISAIFALGRLARPILDETLAAGDRSKAPEGFAERVVSELGARLRHDRIWQVRQAATHALLRLRNRKAVPELIGGLKAELARAGKAKTRQLVHSLQSALHQLTGQDIPARSIQTWEDFWARNGEHMIITSAKAPPPRSSDAKYLKYFTIDLTSDRVLFIVDRSGSMMEPARLKGEYANIEASASKFSIVQRELERLVRSLDEEAMVNVIFFSDDVRIWHVGRSGRPTLLKMNDRNKSDLIAFIRLVAPAGATNIWDALNSALDAAGRGVYDKYYKSAFDTIYLLSDGAPTCGPVIDPEEILQHVREVNQLRQVVIHTITFGDVNSMVFMKQLAKENGGKHVHIE